MITGSAEIFAQEITGSEYFPTPDPVIVIEPMMLDFGEVVVGDQRRLDITVSNNGDQNLILEHPIAEGDYFSDDWADWASVVIEPGDQFVTFAVFAPEEVGDFEGTLTVRSNDPANGIIIIPMRGSGASDGGPVISVEPVELDFGEVIIGDVPILILTVSNIGREVLLIDTAYSSNSEHFEPFEGALAARSAIIDIMDAVARFMNDRGEGPNNIQELVEGGFLQFEGDILRLWHFTLVGVNPTIQIQAISTSEMRGGAGQLIMYDYRDDEIYGYGMLDDFRFAPGHQYEIPISFLPEETGEYSETFTIISNDPDNPELSITLRGEGVTEEDVVSEIGWIIPHNLSLFKPYPNPFNSTTTITYGLPHPGIVSLRAYNPSGQRITTLFEGHKQAGFHTTEFSSKNIPTGLNFIQLETSEQRLIRKVTIIK